MFDESERKAAIKLNQTNTQKTITDNPEVQKNLENVKNIILILSGKGGVGKSTVAVKLASKLARDNKKTGLLDIDIHGPSVPTLLGMETRPQLAGNRFLPVPAAKNLDVMSMGFLLNSPDDPVIWRGPLKYQMILSFLKDVEWGELDYLVVDLPPGTGDESLSIAQMINTRAGAVMVTTPQLLSVVDVRKAVNFCRKLDMPLLGVVENMSGFVCPHCGEKTHIFGTGGGEKMAKDMGINFLGSIPITPSLVEESEKGEALEASNNSSVFDGVFENIIKSIPGQ